MILDEIVATTRKLLVERKAAVPLAELERAISRQAPPRDFAGALRGRDIRLIAEVKRASPSKGALNPGLDASRLAGIYRDSGAAAVSVLTEPEYFKGSLADLKAVREAVDLPLLRKDFIVDPYQVYEARACGADAILLIVAVLDNKELRSLLQLARSLGMAAIVEVHDRSELAKALEASPKVIGINNRNLADFSVDLETTFSLRKLIPPEVVVVSESGIHNHGDVLRLKEAGVDAVLVGETLVTSGDPAAKIKELLGDPHPHPHPHLHPKGEGTA